MCVRSHCSHTRISEENSMLSFDRVAMFSFLDHFVWFCSVHLHFRVIWSEATSGGKTQHKPTNGGLISIDQKLNQAKAFSEEWNLTWTWGFKENTCSMLGWGVDVWYQWRHVSSVHLSTCDVLLGLRHGAHLKALWPSRSWTHDGRQSDRARLHLTHLVELLLQNSGPGKKMALRKLQQRFHLEKQKTIFLFFVQT